MGNNNSSNSASSTKLSPGKLKLWYDKLSVVQQRQVEMDVNAVLYSGCMAAAPQLFDTTVHQQEADNNDDDNVVGDWDPDNDLDLGGDVASNKDQEIAASIRGEEDNVDFNDEGENGLDNKFNNLCDKDDTYNDANLVARVGVADNNNQKIAAEQEAKSVETANTTSYQAPYKAELVIGTNRSEYLMQKILVEMKTQLRVHYPWVHYCHQASTRMIY